MSEFTTAQVCRAAFVDPKQVFMWYNNGNSIMIVLKDERRFGVSKSTIRASLRSKENERDIQNGGVHCGADIDRADSVHNRGSD